MSLVDLFIKIEQRETSSWDFDYYSEFYISFYFSPF